MHSLLVIQWINIHSPLMYVYSLNNKQTTNIVASFFHWKLHFHFLFFIFFLNIARSHYAWARVVFNRIFLLSFHATFTKSHENPENPKNCQKWPFFGPEQGCSSSKPTLLSLYFFVKLVPQISQKIFSWKYVRHFFGANIANNE